MFNKNIPNINKAGTALLMTILILNSIILITMAAAKLIVSSVQENGTQIKSTKAYFAAEAGAERILYEYRKGTGPCATTVSSCHFAANLSGGGSYKADWISGNTNPGSNTIFVSAGIFAGLKRSDEIDFFY